MKTYITEAIGTFALTLVVALSLAGSFPISTPALAALTLGLFVYSVGHISGTHINPAVTLGLLSLRKIPTKQAVGYILAQFAGAAVATGIVAQTVGLASLVVEGTSTVFWAELIGTAFFAFGIASVVYGKVTSALSGVVIGGSLLLGITLAALLGSNGVLNPAVAFGIGSFNLIYILGPIIGSVIGMQVYKRIA